MLRHEILRNMKPMPSVVSHSAERVQMKQHRLVFGPCAALGASHIMCGLYYARAGSPEHHEQPHSYDYTRASCSCRSCGHRLFHSPQTTRQRHSPHSSQSQTCISRRMIPESPQRWAALPEILHSSCVSGEAHVTVSYHPRAAPKNHAIAHSVSDYSSKRAWCIQNYFSL